MSKKSKILSILLLPFFLVAGCATIISGTTQPIHLQAIDARTHEIIPGAMCTLCDSKGRMYEYNTNPGVVIVTKGQGALTAHCIVPGYRQKEVGIGSSFNAWTIANVILFWPGIFVDALSGAIQNYPSHITVLMEPNGRRF
jgi:hypothetical protein